MAAFFGGKLYKKKTFSFLKAPRQIFLTIFNEKNFLKAWGTRLAAMVALNKDLEKALIYIYPMKSG